ncbi:hypothetical protein EJ08DRAFT_656020 [Tothia fuscella]|uniref:Uncharacterized protein n=1 Tax=Tothia fuscella TaxID=1048955 RepID=A0A9P4P1Q1_9PEZI|nr:hypothetical protein EJ08DRAFT_656020 [Tothia fuscella]
MTPGSGKALTVGIPPSSASPTQELHPKLAVPDQNDVHQVFGDFGTTYSGFSLRKNNAGHLVEHYPGHLKAHDTPSKSPSRFAYNVASIKEDDTVAAWGFEDMSSLKVEAAFKLGLVAFYPSFKKHEEYIGRKAELESKIKELYSFLGAKHDEDAGKTAKEHCKHFLKSMYNHVIHTLQAEFHLQTTMIEFCFTVPAFWPATFRKCFQDILLKSGYGKAVSLISEQEAAAFFALSTTKFRLIEQEAIMVLDLGGGTADAATYFVGRNNSGETTLKELTVGSSRFCESMFINTRLVNWLKITFGGDILEQVDGRIGPGTPFFDTFEAQKRNFGEPNAEPEDNYKFPLTLAGFDGSESYHQGSIILPRDTMQQFFDECIKEIQELVGHHLEYCDSSVEYLFMTGGLGCSRHVYDELSNLLKNSWAKHRGLSLFRFPEGPDLVSLSDKRADKHYGVIIRPWMENFSRAEHGKVLWVIRKYEYVEVDEVLEPRSNYENLRGWRRPCGIHVSYLCNTEKKPVFYDLEIVCSDQNVMSPFPSKDDPGVQPLETIPVDLNKCTFEGATRPMRHAKNQQGVMEQRVKTTLLLEFHNRKYDKLKGFRINVSVNTHAGHLNLTKTRKHRWESFERGRSIEF